MKDDRRVENAIDATYRTLACIEINVMIWVGLAFSPWRITWVWLLIKAKGLSAFVYAVKWSYWIRKVQDDQLPADSVNEHLAAMGDYGLLPITQPEEPPANQ